MSSLLVQIQNMGANVPSWMELGEHATVPQYGVFALASSASDHSNFDPILKRTACITLPAVDVAAKMLFPRHWQGVIDFVRTWKDVDVRSVIQSLRQISSTAQQDLGTAIVSHECCKIAFADVAEHVRQIAKCIPDASAPDWKVDPVVMACPAACRRLNVHPSERILWKLYHLADAHRYRLPILLHGPRQSGKSTLIRTWIDAQSAASGQTLVN